MSKHFEFPCGCKFPVVGTQEDGSPQVKFDPNLENIPLDCTATWDLISEGNTKGVFQLESRLGQMLAKKLKPRNIEHLSALVAIMRPGCISIDTKIIVKIYTRSNGNPNYKRITIGELYTSQEKYPTIVSVDENTGELFHNNMKKVIDNGQKNVYRIKLRKTCRNDHNHNEYYDLKCTDDHRLLTPTGWKELRELNIGERFAVLRHRGKPKTSNGNRYFRETCFQHYNYHCVFCDWQDGSLDVNHLNGNRSIDNSPDNLCFMCPNHHRMYTEHKLTEQETRNARAQYALQQYPDIEWAEYQGKEFVKKERVFDIVMDGPNHNFIAGNVVVHNCLEAIREGKSVTEHYIDRKNGVEPVEYFHPSLENALSATYGEMVYQEQAMQIARDIAGFNLQQADILRKAIGKKKPEIMAKVKVEFLEGCEKTGIVTKEEAEEIFGWIEKSQRYSFNKSHSVSYAINGYLSAYAKAHFPRVFFTSYLRYSQEKQRPQDEVYELAQNARMMDIDIYPPNFIHLNKYFRLFDRQIFFGFSDIKGIGESVFDKMIKRCGEAEKKLNKGRADWSWLQFLIFLSQYATSTAIRATISAGALNYMGVSRTKMLYEYEIYSKLSGREQKWVENLYLDHNNTDPDGLTSPNNLEDILELMVMSDAGRNGACATAKRRDKVAGLLNALREPPHSMEDMPEWITSIEENLLGIPLTCTSVDSCNTMAANCTCRDFIKGTNGQQGVVILACQIDAIKEIQTKKGKAPGKHMAFLTVSDSSGMLDSVVAFPQQWKEHKSVLTERNTVMLSGKRGKEKDSLVIQKVWQI